MSDMFRHYPQPDWYTPNNRKVFVPREILTIMPGETTTHSFEVPFICDRDLKDFKAIYKLGIDIVLEKKKDECTITPYENLNKSLLSWTLSSDETMEKFNNTNLDAKVQLVFVKDDDSIVYSDVMDIKLENSLMESTMFPTLG